MKTFPLGRLAIAVCLALSSARAATFNIANGDVTSPSGLKAAITASNSNSQDDTIELFAGGTYTLTSGAGGTGALPQISPDSGHKLTIHGNGAKIDGNFVFRIFFINSGSNVTITNLSLVNGNPGAVHGGAIYNDASTASTTLTIISCLFDSNSGDYGGAIWNDGSQQGVGLSTATLTVSGSTFTNNFSSQHGGAIWNESGSIVMNVSNSTFSGNASNGSAGAIQFDGSAGTATGSITNCTFTQNSARNYGGAINVDGAGGSDDLGNPVNGSAILSIANCTFDRNTASHPSPTQAKGWGGGVALDGSNGTNGSTGNATVDVDSCTFSGNFSKELGDAIYLSETTAGTTVLQLGNSILASNDADYNITTDNISGGTTTVISQGYNLSDDASCGTPSGTCNDSGTGPGGLLNHLGDQRNTNPMLDSAGLKDNGGPVQTIAVQVGSPALDQGKRNTVIAQSTDARGEPRPFDDLSVANAVGGDGSDIGAYEADVRIISSKKVAVDLQFTFTTILGHNYEIQSQPSLLPPPMWSTVTTSNPPPPIAGTGGIIAVTVPNAIGGPGSGFYRVHQLP